MERISVTVSRGTVDQAVAALRASAERLALYADTGYEISHELAGEQASRVQAAAEELASALRAETRGRCEQ